MKIKDLGYAALGATLSVLSPKFAKRLAIDAAVLKIKRFEMFRQMRYEYAASKGAALSQLNYATSKVRESCNHKKGGSLGILRPKAWHHTGTAFKELYDATGKFLRQEPIPGHNISGGASCGISRWEGEWTGDSTYLTGQGDAGQYAVTKHQYANGDVHVRCMRCGKNWRPGTPGYEEALNFQTLNVTSSSVQFGIIKDNGLWHTVRDLSTVEEQQFQQRYNEALGDNCS